MFTRLMRNRCAAARSGMVYVAVLGVAMIVGVISIASLHVARLEIKELDTLDDMARARLAARSGVECLLAKIKNDLLWRTTYASGVTAIVADLSNTLAGGDNFTFTLTDSDGNLGDNAEDSVTLRCVGRSGNARHVIEVLMQPTGEGLSSLSASIHAGGSMDLESAVTTSQVMSSNGSIDATHSSGSVQGNAQAAGLVLGTVTGTRTNGMPALDMPDPTSVFDYYLSNGTPINYGQLNSGKIERTLLSEGSNPYSGVTNPQGIYVVNCQGNKVTVRDCRIHGTVVFVNATAGVEINGSVLWEPVLVNFPSMMVQGDLEMDWNSQVALTESSYGANFNPSHTPYLGVADSDASDSYTGMISGLIYVSDDMVVEDRARTKGVVVVGDELLTKDAWTATYESTVYSDAPPGFGAGTEMELVPGTWKQVSY